MKQTIKRGLIIVLVTMLIFPFLSPYSIIPVYASTTTFETTPDAHGSKFDVTVLNDTDAEITGYTMDFDNPNGRQIHMPSTATNPSTNKTYAIKAFRKTYAGFGVTETMSFAEGIETIDIKNNTDKPNLTAIHIPASVTSITEGSFANAPKLKTITVADGNPNYQIENHMLVSKDGTKLYAVPPKMETNVTDYTIPEKYTYIGDYAFSANDCFKSVHIPNHVTHLGEGVFANRGSIIPDTLETVSFGDQFTELPTLFFYGSGIKTLDVSNFSNLWINSLAHMPYVKTLKLNQYFTFKGLGAAFGDTPQLETIEVKQIDNTGNGHKVINGALYEINGNAKGLKYYPAGKKDTVLQIDEGTTQLMTRGINNPQYLTEIKIPGSVKRINQYAIGISNLTSEENYQMNNPLTITFQSGQSIKWDDRNYVSNYAFSRLKPGSKLIFQNKRQEDEFKEALKTREYLIRYQNEGDALTSEHLYEIAPSDINDAEITYPTSVEYTGAAIQPQITVKNAYGDNLIKGTDYTVSYGENKRFNGTIIVSGTKNTSSRGATTGTKTLNFTINNTYMEHTIHYDANGGENAPSDQKKTTNGNLILTKDAPARDQYEFVAWNTKADGTGTTYQLGDTYTEDQDGGTVTLYAQWKKKVIKKQITYMSTPSDVAYSGGYFYPAVIVKSNDTLLIEGTDYAIFYENNKDCGIATVRVVGIGDYTGTMEKTFKIYEAEKPNDTTSVQKPETTTSTPSKPTKKQISYVSTPKNVTYNGKNQYPNVVVKSGNTTLRKNRDYKISYSKHKNCGKAKVVITGMGNYTGTKTKYFVIIPKKAKLKKVKAGKKQFKAYFYKNAGYVSGYQIRYSLKKNMKGSKSKYTSKTSMTVKKLKKKKNYYIQVRAYKSVSGKKYFGQWSSYKKCKTK